MGNSGIFRWVLSYSEVLIGYDLRTRVHRFECACVHVVRVYNILCNFFKKNLYDTWVRLKLGCCSPSLVHETACISMYKSSHIVNPLPQVVCKEM
jgi:hypothetical protein